MLNRWKAVLRSLLRKSQAECELDEELRDHLERQAEQNLRLGMNPDDAQLAARRAFGGVEQAKEQSRDVRGVRWIDEFQRDLQYGLRILAGRPGFTLAVVLALALGVGVNTTIFTWLNALFFRPLPGVAAAHELVTLHSVLTESGGEVVSVSYPDYLDFRDRNEVCDGLTAFTLSAFNLDRDRGRPERIWGLLASGNYFDVLGVKAAVGRSFLKEEDQASDPAQVAVISHNLWRREFGADPQVIGKPIRLNGRNFTVIGVAPQGFAGTYVGLTFDVWIPLAMQKQMRSPIDLHTNRAAQWLTVMGRRKPGVGFAEAQANLQTIARQLEQSYPGTNAGTGAKLFALAGEPNGFQVLLPVLSALMAVAGLTLLVACVNIAALLLVRAAARRKEIGVRLALGASRGRIVRQLLTECLLLAVMGASLGLLLTLWLVNALPTLLPPMQLPIGFDFKPDARVLGFTLAATLLTTLLCGLAPALAASKADVIATIKGNTGMWTGASHRLRLRSALVAAQLALSLVLLVCAGLFIRSLQQSRSVHPGFNPQRVWLASFDLFMNGYDKARGRDFYRRIRARIAALPSVESVCLASGVPPYILGSNMQGVEIEDYTPRRDEQVVIPYDSVGPGYFETMQIPLVSGRGFRETDNERTAPVVVVSELMARQYWPGRSPIGRRLHSSDGVWHEVIGVARDVKQRGVTEPTPPFLYFSLSQSYSSSSTLIVRTMVEPGVMQEAVRRELRALDASLPVFDEKTLEAARALEVFDQQLAVNFLSGFGLLALALAATGLYGVMAYTVTERTHEIGVRLALGAQRSDIMKLTIGQGARLIAVGSLFGLLAAFATTRLLKGFLFGVSAADSRTFLITALGLILFAFAACWLPARRATKIDPLLALKFE
jgi:macrolide transport system ATP-binding/permease protein